MVLQNCVFRLLHQLVAVQLFGYDLMFAMAIGSVSVAQGYIQFALTCDSAYFLNPKIKTVS